jgi:hypothetical protein
MGFFTLGAVAVGGVVTWLLERTVAGMRREPAWTPTASRPTPELHPRVTGQR